MHILFVCTGNICRSPTAERLAVAYATAFGIPNFTSSSAGTRAVIGHALHQDAAPVLAELGGDASNFTARQLTPKIASSADLVLTMTRAHSDYVLELAPQQLYKTFTLSEAARLVTECGAQRVTDLGGLRPHLVAHEVADIIDPIGQSSDVFKAVGAQIAALIRPILRLCQRT